MASDMMGSLDKGSKLRKMETKEEKRHAYRILVGKPEEKRPLGRPRLRLVDNFRMDLREMR
jgi:hypothetical protein